MHINLTDYGFDEREKRLIENCKNYANNDPAGVPGHQLMLIIAKLDNMVRNPPDKLLQHLILNAVDCYSQEWDGSFDNLQITLEELVELLEKGLK